MTLLLFTSVESACAQKVRLVLAEKQLVWNEQSLNLRRGDQFAPEYLKLNPKAVVPTLVHDGVVIRESSIINEYLEEAYPQPRLSPVDLLQRSQMRLWVKTGDDELHPAIGVLTYATVLRHQMNEMKTPQQLQQHFASITDPKRRERQQQTHEQGLQSPAAELAIRNLRQIIMAMDTALSAHQWLVGENYSLADAAFAPYMVRLHKLGLTELWRQHPSFANWLQRVTQRENALRLENPWGSEKFNAIVNRHAEAASSDLSKLLQQN